MGKHIYTDDIQATDSALEMAAKNKLHMKKKRIKSPKITKWRFSPDGGRTLFIGKNRADYLRLKKKHES